MNFVCPTCNGYLMGAEKYLSGPVCKCKPVPTVTVATIALLVITLALSSCAVGPDYTPDVTSHSASFGGVIPTFTADGRMAAFSAPTATSRRGTNIFD